MMLASCAKEAVVQEESSQIQYMPFQETPKSGWGLIGTDGQVLVNDDYKQMPTVVMNDRYFARNKEGKWELYALQDQHPRQIGDEYSQVGAFIGKVAPVVEEGKSIEFIDVDGNVKFVLDRVDGKEVTTCTNFSDGVAVFRAGKYCGAINEEGTVIADARYIEILPANEGKMLALDKKYEKNLLEGDLDNINYSVLDTKGQEISLISNRRFKIASRSFVGGALVVTDESGNGTRRTGLIDANGDWIIKPTEKIKSIKSIQDGTFIYSDGDAYGIMNFDGTEVVRPRYANLLYANQQGLLFAKPDKDKAEYRLMDMQENQIGRDEYTNVLPFFNGKAIVQESAENWILIDEQGQDQRLKQDIYSISASALGSSVLTSEYVDYESVIGALKLTKDGFLDMTLQMDAQHLANTIGAIEAAGELGGETITAVPAPFIGQTEMNGHFIVRGINLQVSSSFDEPIATSADAFSAITPNQIGIQIPAAGILRGKSGIMARDIIARVQAFGQTVKANQNAAIVSVGETAYFVANSGTDVYVVYGYLDVNQIDITPYEQIVNKEAAPVVNVKVDDVFDIIEDETDDYQIGGDDDDDDTAAVSSTSGGNTDFDEWLDNYESYVKKYISYVEKAANGDASALAELPGLMQTAQELGQKVDAAKGDLTPAQVKRYTEINLLMVEAAQKMK
jgi:hypothetical protein